MRRAMFGEPLLAHPAEIDGAHATWHPHPGDDDDRDQRDDNADDEQHMVLTAFSAAQTILTRGTATVCAVVHSSLGHIAMRRDVEGAACSETGRAGLPDSDFRGLRVHSRTARSNAGAYT